MNASLQDLKVNVRIRLAILWVCVMFCFIYADYFELFAPNKLSSMLDGRIGPLGYVTQGKLLGTSVMMSIPSVMAAFAVFASPAFCKWLNIIVAAIFVVITVLVIHGSWYFYVYFGLVEIILLLFVIWNACKWPRAVDA